MKWQPDAKVAAVAGCDNIIVVGAKLNSVDAVLPDAKLNPVDAVLLDVPAWPTVMDTLVGLGNCFRVRGVAPPFRPRPRGMLEVTRLVKFGTLFFF